LFYNLQFFLDKPLEIFALWQGGMSFHGGALGVIASLVIYSLVKGIPMFRLGDIAALCCTIGLFFGRIANFINGELFGRVTDAPIGMVFPHGGPEPRHPSQLYQAALEGLSLFIILNLLFHFTRIRNVRGAMSGAFLIGYAVFRSIAEFFREPDTQLGFIVGQVTMGQILCIPMALAGVAIILYARRAR
jgi:phosphatidylglycerol:prolipoprotein diacylglycerol transferase